MTSWTRPYKDPMRLFSGTFAMVGTLFFTFVAFRMAADRQRVPLAAVLVFVGFAAVWLTFAWRLHRTALAIDQWRIRVRWLLRTRTLTREQVCGFRTDRDWLVPERLWLQLCDGTMVRTPVRRRCATAYRVRDGGTVLAHERYEKLLADLKIWMAHVPR